HALPRARPEQMQLRERTELCVVRELPLGAPELRSCPVEPDQRPGIEVADCRLEARELGRCVLDVGHENRRDDAVADMATRGTERVEATWIADSEAMPVQKVDLDGAAGKQGEGTPGGERPRTLVRDAN